MVASSAKVQQSDASVKSNESTNQGSVKAGGKEHIVTTIPDSESVSKGASEFLETLGMQKAEQPEILSEHTFVQINSETEELITKLLEALSQPTEGKEKTDQPKETKSHNPLAKGMQTSQASPSQTNQSSKSGSDVVYTSLFALASSFNKAASESKQQRTETKHTREESKPMHTHAAAHSTPQTMNRDTQMQQSRYDQQGQGKGGQNKKDQDQQQQKKKKKSSIKVNASKNVEQRRVSGVSAHRAAPIAPGRGGGVGNIYIRFMALMGRILGQAEAEAHELYLRIKDRTDNVDTLTTLISKINSEKGDIDWSKDPDIKTLLEKARALGVDIPDGKCKWSEKEKSLLKENIQMRKDSMEKMTQLERTDMQRFLQEASQCHQARSNVLKLLKEVMDTIVHNMRP